MSAAPQAWRSAAAMLFFPLLLVDLIGLYPTGLPAAEPTTYELIAEGDRQWFRGNLHTHSLWSDGDDYLESIALWYREHGYQFLSFTDHNVLADRERWSDIARNKGKQQAFDKLVKNFPDWVETRETDGATEVRLRTFAEVSERFNVPGEFLLIQGEEVSDSFERLPIHLNATNVQELITPRRGSSVAETIQNNVNALLAQRQKTGEPMIIHLNHPNFGYAVTAEDLMQIVGEKFFEVYNGHPGVNDSGDHIHPSTERLWDIVNTKRLAELELPVMYGIATDDGHNYHNIPSRASEPGRGWVMVLANQLTPAHLIEALETGAFYASSGVNLQRIAVTPDALEIEIQPVAETYYTIEFIGTRVGYDPASTPVLDEDGNPIRTTQQYSNDIGQVLETSHGTKARYEFAGDEIYVRARITSSTKHPNPSEPHDHEMAWTQPVVLHPAK